MTTLNHHVPAAPLPAGFAHEILGAGAAPAGPSAPDAPVLDSAEDARPDASGAAARDASRDDARGDARARELTSSEFTAVAVVAALVAVLGLLGFVNSFAAVAEASEPSFGRLAWTVPLGIDLGIAIFAALDIVLARIDMRIRWLRFIPWALTAATVYLNVAGEHGMFGKVAHAVLPALWVVAVEIAAHVIRLRAGIAAGTRIESIRASRWILAPWPTAKLWRRMVLWEIRSYPDALTRERARLLALTALQDTYGRWTWRRKAPRRVRALYRLGELTDATLTAETGPVPSGGPPPDRPVSAPVDRPALESGPSTGPSRTRARTATARSGGRKRGPSARPSRRTGKTAPPPDVDDLMPLGQQIAADLTAAGQPLTRNVLAAGLRKAGQSAGNARVGALLARLKTEPPSAAERAEKGSPTAEGDTP
ncbi:DUF2637 domain-containing protein [Actinomadura sp. KC345]|uniref:DUF2637 domain-containing protein n=1 Tax=Actinomadura sp. KC345 TaxID=2530371 RepID=UPI0010451760|nr:DUF2637 domain-containing protein [Actinomadura sp. KC345]TDC41110.1 DUF2637 domain-containing protein [Actinomadura sp. KC345]